MTAAAADWQREDITDDSLDARRNRIGNLGPIFAESDALTPTGIMRYVARVDDDNPLLPGR